MIFQMLRNKINHSENDAENTKLQFYYTEIRFSFLDSGSQKGKSIFLFNF